MTQTVTGATKTAYARARTVRLQHRETGEYLHLSAEGLVRSTTYAWLGYRKQARKLRDMAAARGVDWPYRAVLA